MHSVYWWRALEFEAERAKHAREKGVACFATNPNSLCCAGTQLLSTATFTTLTFRMLSHADKLRLNQLRIAVTTSMTKRN